MNHLAHALLAGSETDMLLGGMLGDFWRGAPDPSWRPGVTRGVILHRKIDVYTDRHDVVADARNVFEAPYRRYAGILLDVYFDHVLARDMSHNSSDALDALSARLLDLLHTNRAWLPESLNRFAQYFRSAGLFGSYAQRTTIENVLAGIGRRLKRDNPLATAGIVLWKNEIALEAAFARFFPDLVRYAAEQRAAMSATVIT